MKSETKLETFEKGNLSGNADKNIAVFDGPAKT